MKNAKPRSSRPRSSTVRAVDRAVGRRRRQRHRVGLAHAGRDRLVVPAPELGDRVGRNGSDRASVERSGPSSGTARRQRCQNCGAWDSTTLPSPPATSTRPTASTPRPWASSSYGRAPARTWRRLGPAPRSTTPATARCSRSGTCTTTNLPDFDPAISTGLGLPNFVNHIAFDAPDLDDARREAATAGSRTATTSCASTTVGARRSTPTTRTASWSSSARRRGASPTTTAARREELLAASRARRSTRSNRRSSSSKRRLTRRRHRLVQRRDLAVGAAGELAQHLVGVLAERRADVADRARRARELRHHARHRDVARRTRPRAARSCRVPRCADRSRGRARG